MSKQLFDFVEEGNLDEIKRLIGKEDIDVNFQDELGRTALMWASWEGHLNVVKYLISQGAGVNIQDDVGWMALMFASRNGHFKVVEYLVNQGANVNLQNKFGETAYDRASKEEVIKFLEDNMGK